MIAVTIFETATGRIRWRCDVRDTDEANEQRESGLDWTPGHHSGASHWVDPATGLVEDRPMIDLPPPHALVGSDWIVPLAPAGTEVWLDGQHLGTTETDDEIVIPFPLPGLWRVELRPPFPWREAGCNVEVSHAD